MKCCFAFALLPVHCLFAITKSRSTPSVSAIGHLVKSKGFTTSGPGLAIWVHQPGKPLFREGYGAGELEGPRTSVTPRTMSRSGLGFQDIHRATAILLLHEQGKLSLDDEVRKFVPEFAEYDTNQFIRICDLLRHVSGLPDYLGFENCSRLATRLTGAMKTTSAEFGRHREKHPPRFAVGGKYEYSNSNFLLLALVIERVAKKSFGAFLRDEIYGPAGLKHTFVYESPTSVPKDPAPECINAVGYGFYKGKKQSHLENETWGAPPYRHEKMLTVGDGGVWSNLEDLAQWDAAFRAGRLLKPETICLGAGAPPRSARTANGMATVSAGVLYFAKPDNVYGYGHDGSWAGFKSSYYRYLTADRSTVLLSNRGDFEPDGFWLWKHRGD